MPLGGAGAARQIHQQVRLERLEKRSQRLSIPAPRGRQQGDVQVVGLEDGHPVPRPDTGRVQPARRLLYQPGPARIVPIGRSLRVDVRGPVGDHALRGGALRGHLPHLAEAPAIISCLEARALGR